MASIIEVETNKGKAFDIDYYDINGARKRKRYYGITLQTAKDIAKALEGKKSRIKLGDETLLHKNEKLRDVIEYYLNVAETQKKQSTISREKNVYNALLDYLGNIPIGKIRFRDLQQYTTHRFQVDKLKPATIDLEIRKLRQFFNFLVRHDFIERNPAKGLNPPKQEKDAIRFLTPPEIEKLIQVIEDKNFRDIVLMYLNTGARRSELLPKHFSWDNVDLQAKQIRLFGKGDKTRWVPLNQTAVEILKRRKNIEKKEVPFDFKADPLYKRFKRYTRKAELDGVSIHTLRKTYGSLLVQNGVDIFTVSKLLGHSTVRVTESHYATLLQRNLTEGVKVLDDIMDF